MTSFPKWIWMNSSFNHVILYHFVLVWLHVWQTITDCIGVFHVHFICIIGVMAYVSAPMVPHWCHHDCPPGELLPCSLWLPPFNLSSNEEKEVFGHRKPARTVKCGGWIFYPGKQNGHWLLGVPSISWNISGNHQTHGEMDGNGVDTWTSRCLSSFERNPCIRPAPGQEPAETGVEGASFRIARLPKVLWLHDLLLTDE